MDSEGLAVVSNCVIESFGDVVEVEGVHHVYIDTINGCDTTGDGSREKPFKSTKPIQCENEEVLGLNFRTENSEIITRLPYGKPGESGPLKLKGS